MGAYKLSEFNIEREHRPGAQNVVAKVLSWNPVDNVEGSQISCAALRALALNSREQLIQEHRDDPELGHIYRYLEIPDDGSVNATVCEGWPQDFKLIDGLLFYAKYCTTLGELRVYIPKSLREAIMQEFHDLPLAGQSNSGKCRRSRKPSGIESKSCKSNKGTAGLEDLRIKRTIPVVSTGTTEREGFRQQYLLELKNIRRNTNKHPSKGPETLPGPSNQRQMKRFSPLKIRAGARRTTRGVLGSTVYHRTALGEGDSAWKP
ncbi:hypothetical protein TNCV_513701 [Trichonephila clavipes]|nr:hypothetical protein TNCV_513701 [Trichonephila clavipes]